MPQADAVQDWAGRRGSLFFSDDEPSAVARWVVVTDPAAAPQAVPSAYSHLVPAAPHGRRSVTDIRFNHSDLTEDIDGVVAAYRRLAAMDPPAMRSLVAELKRLSDESLASVEAQASPAARATARRGARRAAAARDALASVETEGSAEHSS